ncbi:dihydrofolate reductase [Candidatus Saccharibacteria bacterium]|nr:dihydrofolate reductase [Candidatus Saccharibacteria bacterium]
MAFSIIACVGKNLELGKNNDLIFHFKDDMKFFRETTRGHTIVMGLNTWKSLGEKPLPNRQNLILSHAPLTELPENTAQIPDFDTFVKENKDTDEEIFIIGGATIYKIFLPYARTLYLTEVDAEKEADVFFPEFNKEDYDLTTLQSLTENQTNFNINKYTRKEK